MASLPEIKQAREEKRDQLEAAGMLAYPPKVPKTHTGEEALADFESLEKSEEVVSIAGRIMSKRGQGAIMFIDVFDGTKIIQAVIKKDTLEDKLFELFQNVVDAGDFVSVTGTLFVTNRGAQSLLVADWTMASKSLLPLPDSHYGIEDPETRLRKRYLDILMHPEMRDLFEKRARFWQVMRTFLEDKGFMEVHTPTLETTTGGAEAEPFSTHHNDYDLDVYLRISVGELWQKRLMAAGFPKTYEIGRAYRNEGSSPDHLQEFTNMEFYWGYADYKMGMQLVQELYQTIAEKVFDTMSFSARGHDFDLGGDWDEIDYRSTIQEATGIDIKDTDTQAIQTYLEEKGVNHNAATFERLVDVLWKHCRKAISGPVFVTGYPDFMQPLAKRDPGDKSTVQQFQVLIGGAEIGKGYSELNDPADQRARFEAQQTLRDAGDMEAMMPDHDFLEMLEHGMPPTCGFGAGDRLFSFLANKPIRETQFFPLVRPKNEE